MNKLAVLTNQFTSDLLTLANVKNRTGFEGSNLATVLLPDIKPRARPKSKLKLMPNLTLIKLKTCELPECETQFKSTCGQKFCSNKHRFRLYSRKRYAKIRARRYA